MPYPIPLDEIDRTKEVHRCALLENHSRGAFARITTLAATICKCPAAVMSVVVRDRVIFIAHTGIDITDTDRSGWPCSHAILSAEVLVINAMVTDPRFGSHQHVAGAPQIGFYAGAPYRTPNGRALGAIAVLDKAPRAFDAEQVVLLKMLAAQIEDLLESRCSASDLRRQTSLLAKSQQIAKIGGWEMGLHTQTLSWTDETYRIHGVTRETHVPTVESGIEWYAPLSRPVIRAAFRSAIRGGPPFDLELQLIRNDGSIRWVRSTGEVEHAAGNEPRIFGIFQDVTEQGDMEAQIAQVAIQERLLVGSNLFDGLSQELTGMTFQFHDMAAGLRASHGNLSRPLVAFGESLQDALTTCRHLKQGLRAEGRSRHGLIIALRSLVSRMQITHKVSIKVRSYGQDWAVDPFVAEHLYRIVKESISNAAKHAFAQDVTVSARIGPENVSIAVADNGHAGNCDAYEESRGLQIIRYRARLIGAKLTIDSTADGGTRIRVKISNKAALSTLKPTQRGDDIT
jgi:signal transduction histidine kinase